MISSAVARRLERPTILLHGWSAPRPECQIRAQDEAFADVECVFEDAGNLDGLPAECGQGGAIDMAKTSPPPLRIGDPSQTLRSKVAKLTLIRAFGVMDRDPL